MSEGRECQGRGWGGDEGEGLKMNDTKSYKSGSRDFTQNPATKGSSRESFVHTNPFKWVGLILSGAYFASTPVDSAASH